MIQDVQRIIRLLRETPHAWMVVALAGFVSVIVIWAVYGGIDIGTSRFFAQETNTTCGDGICSPYETDIATFCSADCAGSTNGTSGCIETFRSCQDTSIFQHYSNCTGRVTQACANGCDPGNGANTAASCVTLGQTGTPTPTATATASPSEPCTKRGDLWFCESLTCGLAGNNGSAPVGPAQSVDVVQFRTVCDDVEVPGNIPQVGCKIFLDATPKLGGQEGYPPRDPAWTCTGSAVIEEREGRYCYTPFAKASSPGPVTCCANTGLSGDCVSFTVQPRASSTTTPTGTPAAATLRVTCSATSAVLNWSVPARANSNTIQRMLPGGSWTDIMTDSGLSRTSYTESSRVAGTQWRHKSGANVASNVVSCTSVSSTATPGPSANTCTIQGLQVHRISPTEQPIFPDGSGITFLSRTAPSSDNPFFFTGLTPGVYALSGASRDTFRLVGYTLCANNDCTNASNPPTSSGSLNVTCPATGGVIDVRIQYEVPSPNTTLTPTPAVTSVPSPAPTPTPGTSPTSTPGPSYPAPTCAPLQQNVALQQETQLTAAGGDGIFRWQFGPGGVQSGGSNANVSVAYGTPGTKAVTVTSAGKTGRCSVTVTGTPEVLANTIDGVLVEQVVRNVNSGVQSDMGPVMVRPGDTVRVSLSLVAAVPTGVLAVRSELPWPLAYIPRSTSINGDSSFTGDAVGSGAVIGQMSQGQRATLTFLARASEEASSQPSQGAIQTSLITSSARLAVASTPLLFGGVGGGVSANPISGSQYTSYTSGGSGSTIGGLGSGVGSGVGSGAGAGTAGRVATGPADVTIIALMASLVATLLYVSYSYSQSFLARRIERASEQDHLDFRS